MNTLPPDVQTAAIAKFNEYGSAYCAPGWDPETNPFSLRQLSADVLRRAEFTRKVSLCYNSKQPNVPSTMSNIEKFNFKLYNTALGRKAFTIQREPEDEFVTRFLFQLGQRPQNKILL
jgi:hypothetical protein